jgi:hypothetical protein
MQANECSVVSTNATQNDASKCIGRRDDLIKNADHRVSTKSRRRDDAKQTHGQCPEEHRVVVQMTSPKTNCKREVFHKKTQSFTPTTLDFRSATDARKASVMVTT